jgi:hypothetical protein
MKKLLSLLIILVVTASCEKDVKFSDPGLQGRKDNLVWRADLAESTISNSMLVINAYRGLETLTLTMPVPTSGVSSLNPVRYIFSADELNNDDIKAVYTFEDQDIIMEYATGFDSRGEILGNAEFVLTKFDATKNQISGTFRFNAKYKGSGQPMSDNVNFQEGAFFNVPIY